MSTVDIPRNLRDEFVVFRRDFDAVWHGWVSEGSESPAAAERARAEVRTWLASRPSDDDIRVMFGHWREMAKRYRSNVVAVRYGDCATVHEVPEWP